MSKNMYRVYYRETVPRSKWTFTAAFVLEEDANWFCRDKYNSDVMDEYEYKIMRNSKLIRKF